MLCPLRLQVDALGGSPPAIAASLIKAHIREVDVDFDDLIDVYTSAAIKWAEDTTHRTIFARNHIWVLKEFPVSGWEGIRLPRGKTRSVAAIRYSIGGQTTTLTGPSSSPAGTGYQEDLRGDDGGVLMPSRGSSWPSADCDVPAPVEIEFSAGWMPDEVPANVLHAILFAIADAYDLRGTPDFQPTMLASGGARFQAREALISAYRLSRWY